MNVLFWVNAFPTVSETFIRDQVVAVKGQGVDVRVYCSLGKDREAMVALAGFEASYLLSRTFDETDVLPSTWRRRKLLVYLIVFFSVFKGHYRYYRKALTKKRHAAYPKAYQLFFQVHFVLKHKIDVIHAHFGNNGLQAAVLKELGLPVKLITTFHGYDVRLGLREGGGLYKPLIKAVDTVVAISDYNRKCLVDFGFSESKIVDLPNGIDVAFFKKEKVDRDAGVVRVLTVARLEKEKALHLGIEAFAALVKAFPERRFEYTIIGTGSLQKELLDLVVALKLDGHVRFVGAKSTVGVKAAMNASDIFMLTSIAEVLPTVLLEAQACELPVLATGVGSVKAMVADGIVVPANDLNALSLGLQRLIHCEPEWGKMGVAGRQFVKAHYDMGLVNKKLIALYNA
ncbi:glycosyltransferase [Snuella lapsa]|uniref:Glycosyltransferase n=1 Tax=Snuella lapsa TaxID=870481 RepID=A0ABP6XU55_9FLAO